MSNTIPIMITAPGREAEALLTLELFKNVGLSLTSFYSRIPPSQVNQRQNSAQALRFVARQHPTSGMLFVEDDVTPAPTFLDWLAVAEHYQRVCYFYVVYHYFYPDGIGRLIQQQNGDNTDPPKQPIPPGLYQIARAERLWGTQCVYIPQDIVQQLNADIRLFSDERSYGPFDVHLRNFLAEIGHKPVVAAPNPVQHRGPPSLVNPKRGAHHSPTFDWPATRPIEELRKEL